VVEQPIRKQRQVHFNKRLSLKFNDLAAHHVPSLPIISDPTTQKGRKLKLQLFLVSAEGGRAVLVPGTVACRNETSSVRAVLLGGGLENPHLFNVVCERTYNGLGNRCSDSTSTNSRLSDKVLWSEFRSSDA